MTLNSEDRLFPTGEQTRGLSRSLYNSIKDLPILSPHGHCEPSWFSKNKRFPDPAQLFVVPDHYVFRMLISQGFTLSELGVNSSDGRKFEKDPKEIWRKFSENYYLFRGTPTAMWLDYSFEKVFGISEPLTAGTSELYFNHIEEKLSQPEYLPQALFDKFNIEVLSTTDSAISDLSQHIEIKNSSWKGRIIPTYRPDSVVDPDSIDFKNNLVKLGELANEDTNSWDGYLKAHKSRRLFFKEMGATATDHGHPSARTENLLHHEAEQLYKRILAEDFNSEEADQFRGQMLTEMAKMSCEDGLVMQIHPGSRRNHSSSRARVNLHN